MFSIMIRVLSRFESQVGQSKLSNFKNWTLSCFPLRYQNYEVTVLWKIICFIHWSKLLCKTLVIILHFMYIFNLLNPYFETKNDLLHTSFIWFTMYLLRKNTFYFFDGPSWNLNLKWSLKYGFYKKLLRYKWTSDHLSKSIF